MKKKFLISLLSLAILSTAIIPPSEIFARCNSNTKYVQTQTTPPQKLLNYLNVIVTPLYVASNFISPPSIFLSGSIPMRMISLFTDRSSAPTVVTEQIILMDQTRHRYNSIHINPLFIREVEVNRNYIELEFSSRFLWDANSHVIITDSSNNIIPSSIRQIDRDEIEIFVDLSQGNNYTATVHNIIDSGGNLVSPSIPFVADKRVTTYQNIHGHITHRH